MEKDPRGLYEVLITEALAVELSQIGGTLEVRTQPLLPAEAPDRIALHLERVVRRVIASLPERERTSRGVEIARHLVAAIAAAVSEVTIAEESPLTSGDVLKKILGALPDGSPADITEPLIPLLDTALLTNAPGEPRVGRQILAEIQSADRIDAVVAFVRWSGIQPLLDELRRHCERGRTFRLLTTTYTGTTELRALEELERIGAQIRVSYETDTTRLHAKAWLFHRANGFSTGYVGSSNLTHSAQVSGLEWNVRVSRARNPDVIEKIGAVFESYWNSGDFEPIDREVFLARHPGADPATLLSPLELRLEPFQERLLEQIELSRLRGLHRNLLVSATGTGKTVMAAVFFARLRDQLKRARLLFVAHREEILSQALLTFRQAVRDGGFGELWVGGARPTLYEHVFASIQSLSTADLQNLDPGHFDVVIVDEFHHAAANTYTRLLSHLRPVELLGLTATPERSDELPILHWFGDQIAAGLRLWDAIDQHRLVPFAYYGINDDVDLRDIPWRRGQGYEVRGLEHVYTTTDAWALLVLEQLRRRTNGVDQVRAIGFCVSIQHARFMARVFSQHGVRALAVWSDTPAEERRAALVQLRERKINVLFSIDLFNEGVDLPEVDTLLLLRPTDSPTLFLQQLGRGLRRSRGKTVCTVLDFVGRHRNEFRIERRFRALLDVTRRELKEHVERGFPFLPAGCHLELDPVAQEELLSSIRTGVPSQWTAKVREMRELARRGEVSLTTYLEETGLDLEDVYDGSRSWSDLREAAGLATLPPGSRETVIRRAIGRMLHADDVARLQVWREMVSTPDPPDVAAMNVRDQRLLRMLVASICRQVKMKGLTLAQGAELLWSHPQVLAELAELLPLLKGRIDHLHTSLANPDVPLAVHARYTRDEILAGHGVGEGATVPPWQTGVYWAPRARTDLFAFTLDKTTGGFSPTTRYRDYAISRDLIHWESQSTTRADSEVGQRYQRHEELGTEVMLFCRLRTTDRAFWFLGPATYVRHESERPMAIVWHLRHPLPGDLFAAFAAAVA